MTCRPDLSCFHRRHELHQSYNFLITDLIEALIKSTDCPKPWGDIQDNEVINFGPELVHGFSSGNGNGDNELLWTAPAYLVNGGTHR